MAERGEIPFNRPAIQGREFEHMLTAIEENQHISGDGPFTARCERILEEVLGSDRVLLTTSCTHALEMSAQLFDIGPGDEVIVPAYTFVSTANAYALYGAKPVFADIRPDTLNLDERRPPELITPRTRAIVPVHYAGVACEMDSILEIVEGTPIEVVEDNAHGLFGRYRGRMLGTLGSLATQSFHETKNITSGEGGALVINRPELAERAEILREKGTNRRRFFRGEVDKYTWVDYGSSYVPSDILAAFLLAQLDNRDTIQANRRRVWEFYAQELSWLDEHGVQLPTIPPECEQPYHMFYLLLPDVETRTALIDYLKGRGIYSVFHYMPLHLSEMGRRFGGEPGDCPVTERVSETLLRLPFYTTLSEADQGRVVEEIRNFYRTRM